MADRRTRRGWALIEVLLSLVLLAIGGMALITLLGQSTHSIESLHASELQTRAAGAQLNALSILSRADLAGRVGRTTMRGFSVSINRDGNDLFDVAIARSDTGLVLLRTTFYRPDTTDAASR